LKKIIDFKASNGQEVIYDESDYLEWSENLDKDSSTKRYFDPILSNNGKIYISTQWSIKSIQPLIELANLKFNFKIEVINGDKMSYKPQIVNKLIGISLIKNIILYGAPGVGKTHNTQKLISLIESGVDEKEIFQTIEANIQNDGVLASQVLKNIQDRVRFITFHQSYSYEDFIEGFKPTEDGGVKRSDGIFKEIVEDAAIEKWQKNDTASNKNVLSASEDSSTSERYQIRSRLQQKPQVKIRSPAESDSKSKPVKAEFIDPLRGILTSDSDMDHINMMDH